MTSIPPEATAFALAQKNFDAIPLKQRRQWFSSFQRARPHRIPMPERVIVELANTCNLDCPMCRVGQYGVNLDRVMPLATFRELAENLFPQVKEVRLNGLGESTVVPNFDAYLDVLDGYSVTVELITNGTGPLATYLRMVDRGATLLFSWDAASPELFHKLRRPAEMPEIRAVVETVARQAAESGRQGNIHLLFTLVPSNIEELPEVVKLAAAMGVSNVLVNVAKLTSDSWMANRSAECLSAFEGADSAARFAGVRLFLPDVFAGQAVELASSSPTAAQGCDRPWEEAVVRWDLDVQVCNMFNPYTYGNLALNQFERIWEGAFAETFRANMDSNNCHPYCKGCAYIGDVYARKQH